MTNRNTTVASKSKSKAKSKTLSPRSKVKPADQWDLSSLFKSDTAWESAFKKWEAQIPGYEKFRGKLGDSAERPRYVATVRGVGYRAAPLPADDPS